MVPDVDEVDRAARPASIGLSRWRALGVELRGRRFDTALLLPNSFHAALDRLARRHSRALGLSRPTGARAADARECRRPSGSIRWSTTGTSCARWAFRTARSSRASTVPADARDAAATLLTRDGWDGRAPLVALAPGAAYGGAKRWPPPSFAELAARWPPTACSLRDGRQRGGCGDRRRGRVAPRRSERAVLNLVGRTDLPRSPACSRSAARWSRTTRARCTRRRGRRQRDRGVRPDRRARDAAARRCARRVLTHRSGAGPACCANARSITAACAASASRAVLDGRRDGTSVKIARCFSIATARSSKSRLPRSRSSASSFYPWTVDAIRALNRAGLPVVLVTNQSGDRARILHRSGRRRGAPRTSPRCSRPAARTSTRITIVRTIPTARSRRYARACDCRKPGRGLVDRAVARARHRSRASFVVGDRGWTSALARAVGARGDSGADRLRR